MKAVSLLLFAALLQLLYLFPFRCADASLMILGHGLTMTGALEPVVRVLSRIWKVSATLGIC